jgi:hypothetical protein
MKNPNTDTNVQEFRGKIWNLERLSHVDYSAARGEQEKLSWLSSAKKVRGELEAITCRAAMPRHVEAKERALEESNRLIFQVEEKYGLLPPAPSPGLSLVASNGVLL